MHCWATIENSLTNRQEYLYYDAKMSSLKQQCVTLFGASLTAAALVFTTISFLISSDAAQDKSELIKAAIPYLQNSCILFLSVSLLFIISFVFSYVYEAMSSEDNFGPKMFTMFGLGIIMSLALALLFYGILQLLLVLKMSWGI
jgi:hypothetical protein